MKNVSVTLTGAAIEAPTEAPVVTGVHETSQRLEHASGTVIQPPSILGGGEWSSDDETAIIAAYMMLVN